MWSVYSEFSIFDFCYCTCSRFVDMLDDVNLMTRYDIATYDLLSCIVNAFFSVICIFQMYRHMLFTSLEFVSIEL